MPHHRIAEVDGIGIGRLDGVDHLEDLVTLLGRTEVATQHRIALAQHPDIAQPFGQRADVSRRHRHPLPALCVLGMVGKLHRIDRPHVDTQTAHGEDGGAVAGTAEHHVGLNRDNGFHRDHHNKGSAKGAIYRMKILDCHPVTARTGIFLIKRRLLA